jgi:hypothetical protein
MRGRTHQTSTWLLIRRGCGVRDIGICTSFTPTQAKGIGIISERLLNDDAHTAISHDDGAYDEAGFFRREEGNHLRDFFGLRGAFDGCQLSVFREKFPTVVAKRIEEVGHHIASPDCIYADPVCDRLQRERASNLRKSTLRRSVSRNTGKGLVTSVGANVDDRTGPVRDHHLERLTRMQSWCSAARILDRKFARR